MSEDIMDDYEREQRRLKWIEERNEERRRCKIWIDDKIEKSSIELLPCWCGKVPEFLYPIATRRIFDEDYDDWDKFCAFEPGKYYWEPKGFSFGCHEHPTKKPGFTVINRIDYSISKFKILDGVLVYTSYIDRDDVNEWKKKNHVTGYHSRMYYELPTHDYEECPPSKDDIFDFVLEDWNRKVLNRRKKEEARKRNCPECGTHLWSKWIYCPNCGYKFE